MLKHIKIIPPDELKFVGRGGFGEVFKRLEHDGSCYAIKIVKARGGFNNYKNDAHALENEYRLVTSLKPHSRIIQFFLLF